MKIVLLDEAQNRLAAEDRWWREHRDAKELFEAEFRDVLRQIASTPGIGQRYRRARGKLIQRVLMKTGGAATMVAHGVAHSLEQEPMASVSSIIQVGIVRAVTHEVRILRREHHGAWTIASDESVQADELITDWNAFRAAAREEGLDARAAVT